MEYTDFLHADTNYFNNYFNNYFSKSYFNDFCEGVVKNGCGLLGHGTQNLQYLKNDLVN